MRRTGRVSGLGALLLALLWIALLSMLSGPTWAQGAQTEGLQAGTPAAGQDTDNTNSPPDLIVVSVNDCTVATDDSAVSITVKDGDGTRVRFVDGQEAVTITAPNGRPQIQGPAADFIGKHAVSTSDSGFDNNGDYTVVSSEGVTCTRTGGEQRVDDEEEADSADAGARTADDPEDLSCDKLLALFRGESSSRQQYGAGSGSRQQYGDAILFADADVRARIEVCLEEEIVEGTGIDEPLPDTGGVSLLALTVLGLVSTAVGLSVIRGGRR